MICLICLKSKLKSSRVIVVKWLTKWHLKRTALSSSHEVNINSTQVYSANKSQAGQNVRSGFHYWPPSTLDYKKMLFFLMTKWYVIANAIVVLIVSKKETLFIYLDTDMFIMLLLKVQRNLGTKSCEYCF